MKNDIVEFKICLTKKTLLFYLAIVPFIVIGSVYNLIGIINQTGSVAVFSAFGLFGFVLLPIAMINTYRQGLCQIYSDRIKIGKITYRFSEYTVTIKEYQLPIKDRPLFSLFKRTYHNIVIKDNGTQKITADEELNIFQKDIEKIRSILRI
jgi:hypothetical protein